MSDKIEEVLIPILKNIQSDMAVVRTDISALKEHTRKLDQRMGAVEAHMSGFLSTSRYHESEVNELRGRVEALEDDRKPDNPS